MNKEKDQLTKPLLQGKDREKGFTVNVSAELLPAPDKEGGSGLSNKAPFEVSALDQLVEGLPTKDISSSPK